MSIKINLTNRLPSSPYLAYLQESRKPIVCLVFTIPFFAIYHLGIWWLQAVQHLPLENGAAVLMKKALGRILDTHGIVGPLINFALLATVALVFLIWQRLHRSDWRLRPWVFGPMILESLVFAIPPFLLGSLLTRVMLSQPGFELRSWLTKMIFAVGAGVYEEFLFRLILMGLLFGTLRILLGLKGPWLQGLVLVIQAGLFAAFHHMPGSADPVRLERIAFRVVAGVYFGYLYLERGFGIAAGSHALYDIYAVTVNQLFHDEDTFW